MSTKNATNFGQTENPFPGGRNQGTGGKGNRNGLEGEGDRRLPATIETDDARRCFAPTGTRRVATDAQGITPVTRSA